MYHLPYGYIYKQSKIMLLILPRLQASKWCSWELHSLGILSFITGCVLPRILGPYSGLIFKFHGQTDQWMTDPWQKSHRSIKTLGNKHSVTELKYSRRKGLSKSLTLSFYSRMKDEVRCFMCQKTKSKSKASSHAPNSTQYMAGKYGRTLNKQ